MTRRTRGTGQILKRATGYAYRYTLPDGTRKYQGGYRTKGEATKALNRALGAAAEGRIADPTRYTWTDIMEAARAHYAAVKTGDRAVRRLEMHLQPYLGGKRLHEISYGVLLAVVNALRADGLADGTIKLSLAYLKVALGVLAKSGKIAAVPPFPTISLNNARTGFFERDDLEVLCEHLPPEIERIARFKYLTGWRDAEMIAKRVKKDEYKPGLRWKDVDWDTGEVRLDPGIAKNRDGRTFPFGLLPELRDVLIDAKAYTDEVQRRVGHGVPYVFHREGEPIRTYEKAWERACAAAELHERKPHDFRRTAVRNLVRAGVSEKIAMELTGHLSRDVFDRYNISDNRDQREAAKRLAAYHEQEAISVGHS